MERESEKTLILVYANEYSPRLQYILKYLFEEICGSTFELTHNLEKFITSEQKKICYTDTSVCPDSFHIKPFGLLAEEGIREIQISIDYWDDLLAFFLTSGDLLFDIFSASFYLITRYEEYLPFQKDEYGRFSHHSSLAYQYNFIHLPLVELWMAKLCNNLGIDRKKAHQFQMSYDIDQAWCWNHKGIRRNIGGMIRDAINGNFYNILSRISVLMNKKADPFDVFSELKDLHEQFNIKPIYFFLLAKKNSRYDKHILPQRPALRTLVSHLSNNYSAGIHPSWSARTSDSRLSDELKIFKQITRSDAFRSRYHYLAFSLPTGYQRLVDHGITNDYSMGYATINGFRASTSVPFRWFDLSEEKEKELIIHPFCWMDATSFYQSQLDPKAALEELNNYYQLLKNISGNMLVIWHNNFLGSDPTFAGWANVHKQFISKC